MITDTFDCKTADSKETIDSMFDTLIKDYSINFQYNENDLKQLPKDSPFIVVSNHPLKGLDGILLLKAISKERPDIKISNDLVLPKYRELNRFFVLENSKQIFNRMNLSFAQKSKEFIKKGMPIGIFPAGNISEITIDSHFPFDPAWNIDTIRFIKSSKLPVVPVYFHVKSTFIKLYRNRNYWLNPENKNNNLSNKQRSIYLRLGQPISVNDQSNFTNINEFGKYLRSKVYCLKSAIDGQIMHKPFYAKEKIEEKIIELPDRMRLFAEIKILKESHLLFNSSEYSVICAPYDEMPLTVLEIGRLREITFREVGEGTNKPFDVDEYDLYYDQLFIWDNINRKIAGAYRFGKGKEIIKQYGIKGFYIQSLFRIDKKAESILEQSLELGRSFIVEEYQKKTLSLFLLWKGILYFLLKNPEYRYLIGPVSISNHYSRISKSLIIKFMKKNFMHADLHQLFRPRNAFKLKENYSDILLESTQNNLQKLDSIISDIEIQNYKVPVLLKKYLKLNAKLLAFNIDPKFNNAIDGLILLDLMDVPFNMIQTLSKEIKDETILDRFVSYN